MPTGKSDHAGSMTRQCHAAPQDCQRGKGPCFLPACGRATLASGFAAANAEAGLEWTDGTQDILDHVHGARPGSRSRAAALVGAGGDHSDRLVQLVAGVSKRIALNVGAASDLIVQLLNICS
jgi:hypothetical protein